MPVTPITPAQTDALAPAVPPTWRCTECFCGAYAHVVERKPDGAFRPGPLIRCVECKAVFDTRELPTAQTDALAQLAEIPPVGSEERERWLMPVRPPGLGQRCEGYFILSENDVLTLMSEARKQGQRDAQIASAPTPDPVGDGGELERLSKAATQGRLWAAAEVEYRTEPTDERWYISQGRGNLSGCEVNKHDALFWAALVNAFRAGKLIPSTGEKPAAFAAVNPSGGWRPMDDCPSDGRNVWILGGFHIHPHKASADGSWWRQCLKEGMTLTPTLWHPEIVPIPPGALAGEAGTAETEGLGPKDDHAASSEATPSLSPPPSPRKGQEENPCPLDPSPHGEGGGV